MSRLTQKNIKKEITNYIITLLTTLLITFQKLIPLEDWTMILTAYYYRVTSGAREEAHALEKIRNEIASKTFKDGGESLNITISAGISEITQGIEKDLALENARHALSKSLTKTNTVSIYS